MGVRKYIHLGYFNGIQAIKRSDMTPKEIIKEITNGKSEDFKSTCVSGVCIINDADVKDKGMRKYGKYVIHYDIADIMLNKPLSEVEKIAENEYIDVYEKFSL